MPTTPNGHDYSIARGGGWGTQPGAITRLAPNQPRFITIGTVRRDAAGQFVARNPAGHALGTFARQGEAVDALIGQDSTP